MFEKKRSKKEFNRQKKRLEEITSNFTASLDNTNSSKECLTLYETYREQFRATAKDTNTAVLLPNFKSAYNRLIAEFVDICTTTLVNIFSIKRDCYYSSETLEESNSIFANQVSNIAKYFEHDDFMSQSLYVNPQKHISVVNAVFPQITILDAVSQNETDISKSLVVLGHPIPIYHELFNSNLPVIIKSILHRHNEDLFIG